MTKHKLVSLMPMPHEQFVHFMTLGGYDPSTTEIVSITPPKATEEQICTAVSDAEVIFGDYSAHNYISRRVLEAAEKCRHIQFASIGYEGIDLEASNEMGITVSNGFFDGVAVSEHTLMLILALLRKIITSHASMVKGEWKQFEFNAAIRPFAGLTLGIFGLGAIGTNVARRARAFGPKIIYNKRRRLTPEEETELGVEYSTFEELIRDSDVLTIHVPLNAETEGRIGREEIDAMKDGAVIINTARGKIVNEDALAEGLKNGKIAGAALDYEPFDFNGPLAGLENVILTPHVASSGQSQSSQLSAMRGMVDNINNVLAGGKPQNIVNGL